MLRIEDVLEQKGISMAELARRADVSRSSMHNTIKKGNPNFDTLQTIASALGVPVAELIEEPATPGHTCPNCGALLDIDIMVKGEGKMPDHKNIRGAEYYK